MKKVKTWIIRGTVRGFEKKEQGEIFLGMEARMVQSGNAKGCPCTDWIEVSKFENSQQILSRMEFYKGQDIVVWVERATDENGKSTYTLIRVREQSRDFISGVEFLAKFV